MRVGRFLILKGRKIERDLRDKTAQPGDRGKVRDSCVRSWMLVLCQAYRFVLRWVSHAGPVALVLNKATLRALAKGLGTALSNCPPRCSHRCRDVLV